MNPRYAVWNKREPVSPRDAWNYVWTREGRFFVIVGVVFLAVLILFVTMLGKEFLRGDVMNVIFLTLYVGIHFLPIYFLIPDLCARKRFLESVAYQEAFSCHISINRGKWPIGSDFGVCMRQNGQLAFTGIETSFRISRKAAINVVRGKSSPGALTFELVRSDIRLVIVPSYQPLRFDKARFLKTDWWDFLEGWLSNEDVESTNDLYPPRTPSQMSYSTPRAFAIFGTAIILAGALMCILTIASPVDTFRGQAEYIAQIIVSCIFPLLGVAVLVYTMKWIRALKRFHAG